jgi:ATP:corrinoid adenosyltransferase
VAVVFWYKEIDWPVTDYMIGDRIDNFKVYVLGKGFYLKGEGQANTNGALVHDKESREGHVLAARAAYDKAVELMGGVDVLILDEVVNAVGDGLLAEDLLLDLVKNRGKTHIILTGRGLSKRVINRCDLVSEVKKVKHPYDKGGLAVRGLDY